MPRFIEPVIGKVVGPLRMKVPPPSSVANSAKSQTSRDRFETALNQNNRRGRYSRKQANLKKLQSKSLPQSSNSSILLGKPPENDEPLHEKSPKQSEESKENRKTREVTISKSARTQISKISACESKDDNSNLFTYWNGRSSSMQNSFSPPKRDALAFDTRCLLLNDATDTKALFYETSMLRHYKDCLRTLNFRDAAPCIMATTTTNGAGSIARRNSVVTDLGIGIQAYNLVNYMDQGVMEKAIDLSDRSVIRGVHFSSTKDNGGAISIPVALQAKNSWLVFSSLGTSHFGSKISNHVSYIFSVSLLQCTVDAIIAEDSMCSGFVSSSKLQKQRPPLNITILSSEISLFCDTNVDSHKDSLLLFLKHITTYVDKGLLSSIQLVTATTRGTILMRQDGKASADMEINAVCLSGLDETDDILQDNYEQAVLKCSRMIEWTMEDWEGRCNTPWNVDAPERNGLHFNLSYSTIENTPLGFKEFTHAFLRDTLVGHQIRLACRLRAIDLPPSIDGTQCSLSLEASYQIFPFASGSPLAQLLSKDMDLLSNMDFKVVKLIPLLCIDASLLFGIPMVVRAGLESDYEQFHEMKVLVRSLFQCLQVREQALLLCGSLRGNARTSSKVVDRPAGDGLFQSPALNACTQFFVLMSQDVPYSMLVDGKASSTGLLFRMAHDDYLLTEALKPSTDYGDSNDDQEMAKQHMEFIESSLSSLDISSFNPFCDMPGYEQSFYPAEKREVHADKIVDCVESVRQNDSPLELPAMLSQFNHVAAPQIENVVTPRVVSIYDLCSNDNSDGGNADMEIS